MTELAIALSCLAAALVVFVVAAFLVRARAAATDLRTAADRVDGELRDAEAAAAALRTGITRASTRRRRTPAAKPLPRACS